MPAITIVVEHEVGLHARPAALFVKKARSFESAISVTNMTKDSEPGNAKSILRVLKLAVGQGHEIKIEAEGTDADNALAALRELIASNFGEH